MGIGSSLREARLRANLSLRELANRAATSHATLVAYESGRVDPGTKVAARIALAAGYKLTFHLEPAAVTNSGRATGDEFADVLALAEHLPHRLRSRHLEAPIFPLRP